MSGTITTNPVPVNVGPILGGRFRGPIQNQVRTLPYMRSTILNWLKPIVVSHISTGNIVEGRVSFQTREVKTTGVIIPLHGKQLSAKREGVRAWGTHVLYCAPDFVAEVNDQIEIRGVKYRIEWPWNWEDYGFREYQLLQSFQVANGVAQFPPREVPS